MSGAKAHLTAFKGLIEGTCTRLRDAPGSRSSPALWVAAPGSKLEAELANNEQGVDGEPWGRTPVETCWGYLAMNCFAGADHLETLAHSLAPEPTMLGAPIMARVALETTGQACWLLDPEIDGRERVHRSQAIRLQGLRRQARMTEQLLQLAELEKGLDREEIEAALADARARIDEVLVQCQMLGLDVQIEERDGVAVVTGLQRGAPSRQSLASLPLLAVDSHVGPLMYDLWSGLVHGYPMSLQDYFQAEPGGDPLLLVPQVHLDQLEIPAYVAIAGIVLMINRLYDYTGWDQTMWLQWRQHLKKRLDELATASG
jgi:hypothetical protein